MDIVDVVESFGLDDQKIKNPDPPTPGIWTGWFLHDYRGPQDDLHRYNRDHEMSLSNLSS